MKKADDIYTCDCDRCLELRAIVEHVCDVLQEELQDHQVTLAETPLVWTEISKWLKEHIQKTYARMIGKFTPKELDAALKQMKDEGKDS